MYSDQTRVPHATGAPVPQGPRNEGEILAAAGWQDTMYASHGFAFGNNQSLVIAAHNSAGSGGQATAHGPGEDDLYNTHGVHGDNSGA